MKAYEIRKWLQREYDQGKFESRKELLEFGEARGWLIKRNSLKYITFECNDWSGDRKRARIKIDFQDEESFLEIKDQEKWQRFINNPYSRKAYLQKEPHSIPSYDIRWVYVIFAQVDSDYAAYVGHTSTISTRLKGHLRSKSTQRSSGPLQVWATEMDAVLQFAVVDLVHGKLGRAKATSKATNLEGFWTERARTSGVRLPGVEGWGQFPTQPPDPDYLEGWNKVRTAAKPVPSIIAKEYDLKDVCVKGLDISEVRKKFEKHRIEGYLTSVSSGKF